MIDIGTAQTPPSDEVIDVFISFTWHLQNNMSLFQSVCTEWTVGGMGEYKHIKLLLIQLKWLPFGYSWVYCKHMGKQ